MIWVFIAHLVGDYLIQSDWMANEKTKRWWPATIHGLTYGLPFLFVTQSPWALFVIVSTHIVIDRLRLAKYAVYVKNFLAPREYWYKWEDCKATGYHKDRPAWMAVWLMIVADNTIHMIINILAVLYL